MTRSLQCTIILMMLSSLVVAEPIEWPVSEGGNGHYYQLAYSPAIWSEAKSNAEVVTYIGEKGNLAMKGHLATITSEDENTFILNAFKTKGFNSSSWIGGFQPPESSEPTGDWRWVTGEPWEFTNWNRTEPNDSAGEDCLAINLTDYPGQWADYHGGLNPEEQTPSVRSSYIIEYENSEPTTLSPLAVAGLLLLALVVLLLLAYGGLALIRKRK